MKSINIFSDIEGGQMNDVNNDENLSLVAQFERYFAVDIAYSPEKKAHAYGIRYRVYCEEFKYEQPECFPNKLEQDEYDDYALHCLITHRQTNIPACCVRLVPAIGGMADYPLPFEKYCATSVDFDFVRNLDIDRRTVCEISRLAVDGAFRRRSGETLTRYGEIGGLDFSQEERRTFSLLAVAGFLAATALTDITGRVSVFAMMEPFLPRMLKRSGIVFQKAGKDSYYHGIRAPYFIKTQSALENMRIDLKTLYQWIYIDTVKAYSATDYAALIESKCRKDLRS
jgi:N-acyl amino acid synthase of PEP-CTERM/exosortase system